MSGLQLSIFNRLKLIKSVVAIGLLFSILSSYNLWAGQRWLPACPIINGFEIPVPYDYALLLLEVILLFFLLTGFKTRLTIFLILVLNLVFILLDQNRLQPWFFIYNSILFILFFYNWRIDNVNNYNSFFILLQLCFSAIYFYSGLQKFNPAFINETYPSFIKPLNVFFSERQMLVLNKTGYVIPIYEMVLCFALLIKSFRFIGIPMVLILHLGTIFLMSPFGSNSNTAAWSWNFVMIGFALLLFSGKTTERFFSVSNLFQKPVFYFVFILFWIMPASNLFNKWETNLSFSFYSGNNNNGKIHLSKQAHDALPLYIRYYTSNNGGEWSLDPKTWCLQELNTPLYPEKRVFEKIQSNLVNITGTTANDVKLVYIEKQKIFEARP